MAYGEYKVEIAKAKRAELETLLNRNIEEDDWQLVEIVNIGGVVYVISGK